MFFYKSIVVNKIYQLTSRHEFKLKPVDGKIKRSIRVLKVKHVLNKYKNLYFWVKKYLSHNNCVLSPCIGFNIQYGIVLVYSNILILC